MTAKGEPGDLRCPVWGCRRDGARWVDVHGWELSICDEHADDVEDNPEMWFVAAGRAAGLRIARRGGPTPDGWWDEERQPDQPKGDKVT